MVFIGTLRVPLDSIQLTVMVISTWVAGAPEFLTITSLLKKAGVPKEYEEQGD